ncbi:FRG domain-containing protein [Staphylococcus equorum]|uniref:FRG domain-containing protein n=1 Tax=Staphylococcus equorum TaxID=246432 RepID=UPI0037DA7182
MEIYKEIEKKLENQKLFNDVKIVVKIFPKIEQHQSYSITNIIMNDDYSENETLNGEIHTICDEINKMLNKNSTWQAFYLMKEMLQKIEYYSSFNFNYYRGQKENWEARPGILRNNTSKEYKDNFEREYKKVAYNFPNELEYIEYDKDNRIERSKCLSILQHYGMKTSLLDLSRNPYIAMLFMVSQANKRGLKNPVLELYEIEEEKHQNKHLFIRVSKDLNNRRIEAQKGAFLNFDHLYDLKETEIEPINRIIIEFDINKEDAIQKIKDDLKYAKSLKNESLANSNIEINDDIINTINEFKSIKENNIKEINNGDIIDDSYEVLRVELLRKLKEYHYYENHLYPDLDKQIDFINAKYDDDDDKAFISEL